MKVIHYINVLVLYLKSVQMYILSPNKETIVHKILIKIATNKKY